MSDNKQCCGGWTCHDDELELEQIEDFWDDMEFDAWEMDNNEYMDDEDDVCEVDEMAPFFMWEAVMWNNQFEEIAIDDFDWKWLVLFFYPADFTFVCPTELEELADKYSELQELWAEVVSVSTDTHFSHLAWKNSSPAIKKIKFPMLWDASWETSRAYWVYQEHNGLDKRWTFIVDPDWILRSIEISSEWMWRSADETIRKIKALKHMAENPWQVCPNKWADKWTLNPWEDLVWKI